jgi:hypothetical protein
MKPEGKTEPEIGLGRVGEISINQFIVKAC